MNAEIKKRWVEALRSGKYKQGKGRLKRNSSYCCLGVLCDLLKDEANLTLDEQMIEGDLVTFYNNVGEVLPRDLATHAGMDQLDPRVEYMPQEGAPKRLYRLSELNDSFRLDFKQIAELIEAQL